MKHNDEVLFRNIIADEKSKALIRKWMANAEIKYPCFTQVLEATGIMKSPFNITFDEWSTTVLKVICKTHNREYSVSLYFGDTDSHPQIVIIDYTTDHLKNYEYAIKKGKLQAINCF